VNSHGLWEGRSTREARQVYIEKWCVDEERHIYYGIWPCCDLEEWRMERVDWTHEGPWKRQFEFGANSLHHGEDDVD
jgi:hypothetical protein